MISLLTKNSKDIRGQIQPVSMSLSLTERGSTATMVIGPEAATVAVGDWVRDETEPGKGIVWRVRSVENDYGTNTRTVQLEHLINILRDTVMFGEITPKTINSKSSGTVTASETVSYILNRQSVWALGSFQFSVSQAYTFNGENLFSALETVSSTLKDCFWSYDFSSYPFRLSIRPRETDVTAEMRMDRNIRSLRRTIDRSQMYTRVYPIGKDNLHISGNYVQKNTGTYGVICRVLTDTSKDTAAKLKTWAQERLDRHCEPSVTVTVSGLDLSSVTGLSLDKFVLGKRCRVPLPEYNTTIEEMISKIQWSDKIADPEGCTVTLANELADVASIMKRISQEVSTGTSSRGGAKKAEEDHAWIEDTADHVALVAEAVGGQDENGNTNWSLVSRLCVDGKGISATVTKTANDMVTAQTKIEQNENNIKLKASKANLISEINVCPEKITIKSKYVDIKGVVTADYINTRIAQLATVNAKSIVATGTLSAERVNGGSIYFRSSAGAGYSYTNLKEAFVSSVELTGPSNNVYTLNTYDANAHKTVVGTFSRAVSSFTGTWSGNHYSVTVSPQNQTGGDTYVYVSTPTWGTGDDANKATVSFYYLNGQTRVEILPATINASSKLQTKSTTTSSNGTVTLTPDSGYIGLSSASVTVSGVHNTGHNMTRYRAGASSTQIPGQLFRRTGSSPNYSYTALGSATTYWYGISNDDLGAYPTVYT